ncbi:phosphoribosyl-ATP diphosphatase [Flaviflagellibacter deserti]|jgi:phosphoribosyl-ATP pyrophosphohydrolase|uniref:Phosphoribosyl-ATP pyrophosphatase n=1 Tax=Flaviflagellibacter deserti TaxID=2267266 RepID=A0ABV9Z4S5_9HYPH
MTGFTLTDLDALVAKRAEADPSQSYTRQLLDSGVEKCAKKLGEEGVEAALAAVTNNREGLTKEAADVLFHLLVLLRSCQVPLEDVMAELKSRTAQSGLQEKAARRE